MALQEGKLFYLISEVASHLDVSASTIRFWEKQIPDLKPRTNKKGNRQFTKVDIDKLQKIKFLIKDQGHTVAGAKSKLSNNKSKVEAQSDIAEKLIAVRSFLENLKERLT